MKSILTFLLLTACTTIFSQNLKIMDGESNEPIPFATVLLYNEGKSAGGYYANEDGLVKLDSRAFDKAGISCIGYAEKSVTKDEVANGVIYLDRVSYQLEDVVVSTDTKTKELGKAERKGKIVTAATMGAEAVLFIDNPDGTEKAVKSFVFKAQTPKGYKTAFRIHFYKKDSLTGSTGEEMPHTDIVKYIPAGKPMRKIEADVTTYGIVLPAEGMFAGIEWLSCTNAEGIVLGEKDYEGWYSTGIENIYSKGQVRTYVKHRLGDNVWKPIDAANPAFGIKVLEK